MQKVLMRRLAVGLNVLSKVYSEKAQLDAMRKEKDYLTSLILNQG